jgi:signal transduction histidine kinase
MLETNPIIMIKKGFFFLIFLFLINAQTFGQKNTLPNKPNELKNLLKLEKDSKTRIDILAALSLIYQKKFVFDSAINYRLEVVKLAEKYAKNDTLFSSITANNLLKISRLYLTTGQFEQAIKYSTRAQQFVKSNKGLLVFYYAEKAEVLRMYAQAGLKKIDESKVYYDSLTTIGRMAYPDAWKKRIALDLGYCDYFNVKNDTKNALKYIKSADSLALNYADETLKSQIKYMYGSTYFENKKYEAALPLLLEAEKTANTWSPDLYVELQRSIARCYGAMGNWQKAYIFYDKFAPLRDSIYVKAAESSLADAEAKFQNKEKQAQIEIKNLQLAQNNTQKKWYLAGLAALLVALGLLFWIFKTKQKANVAINEKNQVLEKLNNELTEANQTKAKLFGIISHDLRSPISQVYQYLKLQELNPNLLNEKQKTDLSGKIQTATGSLLETMEDLLLWSKTQLSQFNINIQKVEIKPIIDQSIQLLKLNIEAKNLNVENLIHENIKQNTDPYFLQIIIRNLLQNAIKASPESSKIKIDFAQNQITIQNKGEIFTHNQYKAVIEGNQKQETLSGLGLKLVDELSQKIGVQINFSSLDNDTLVKLDF